MLTYVRLRMGSQGVARLITRRRSRSFRTRCRQTKSFVRGPVNAAHLSLPLGAKRPSQPYCRTTVHRCRRLSRRRCSIGSSVRAGGDHHLVDSPTDADRTGLWRNRRRACIRCFVRRRRLGAAAGARALLRDLHEPQPSVRGSDRRRRAAGGSGTPRLDRGVCDRDGQCLPCSRFKRGLQPLRKPKTWCAPQLDDDDCALLLTGAESFSGAAVRRPSGGLLVTLGDRCGVGSFSWSR